LITAAERIAALDDLPARELIGKVEALLNALAAIMNEETTLLRAGHFREAGTLTADKTRLAQEYVGFARSVQRQLFRLRKEAPDDLARLRSGHERLAQQMADNLRVIATARDVTENLLTDVAMTVGAQTRTKTYGASGEVRGQTNGSPARGIAVNRAL
jgi:hypothetical protein